MNNEKFLKNNGLINNWNGLSSSTRWFLFSALLNSLFFTGWNLFFNFFILSRGYDKEFLGLVSSIPSVASLIFSIPVGLIADRIGRKKAMVIGLIAGSAAMIMEALVQSSWLIILFAFLGGLGMLLYSINSNPMLIRLSNKENRNMVFSLNWALLVMAGAVGSVLAGQLPAWIESVLGFLPGSLESYQTVLILSMVFTGLSVVPIFMINFDETRDKKRKIKRDFPDIRLILKNRKIMKLFIPNLTVGIGAAMLVPYLNLFLVEKFGFPESTLGTVFALGSFITGISTLFNPMLVRRLNGRIRTVTLTQVLSLLFLLVLGFSPWPWLAVIGFLLRGALMNMAMPLWDAFVMEQVPEEQQSTMASIQRFSWEVGWATVPFISGIIQEHWGFPPLFIVTGIFYMITSATTFGFFHHMDKIEQLEMEAHPA